MEVSMRILVIILLCGTSLAMQDSDYLKCVNKYNQKAEIVFKKKSQDIYGDESLILPTFSGEEVCGSCFNLEDKKMAKRCK